MGKVCTKCGIEKKETEFHWVVKGERRKTTCRDCFNAHERSRKRKKGYVNPRKVEEAARKEEADLFNQVLMRKL